MGDSWSMDRAMQKPAFEHAQNRQIQIIFCMRKVSAAPLLEIYTFCCIKRF